MTQAVQPCCYNCGASVCKWAQYVRLLANGYNEEEALEACKLLTPCERNVYLSAIDLIVPKVAPVPQVKQEPRDELTVSADRKAPPPPPPSLPARVPKIEAPATPSKPPQQTLSSLAAATTGAWARRF